MFEWRWRKGRKKCYLLLRWDRKEEEEEEDHAVLYLKASCVSRQLHLTKIEGGGEGGGCVCARFYGNERRRASRLGSHPPASSSQLKREQRARRNIVICSSRVALHPFSFHSPWMQMMLKYIQCTKPKEAEEEEGSSNSSNSLLHLAHHTTL